MIVSASRTDLIFLFFGMASRLLGTIQSFGFSAPKARKNQKK